VSAAGIISNVAVNDEQRKNYLGIIINKSAEMERLINQLFMFSKLDIDEFPLEMQHVDCGAMIEDCIEELSGEYAIRGLVLASHNLPHGMHTKLDPLLFRQVIINILENAVRYKTKEKGRMTIDCNKVQNEENENIEIILADDGPGVPPEFLDKLFDVFYRADKSRSKKGSGLGLAISAKLIAKMGGTIHAALSKAGGLAIVISFPLVLLASQQGEVSGSKAAALE
jgi:signal transduction histidine kinase